MRPHALTWLVHLPALVTGVEREGLDRQIVGVSRERMLREIAEALEALSVERPLILMLDDLH